MGKKIPHLSKESLYALGEAGKAQQAQLNDLLGEKDEIEQGLIKLEDSQYDTYADGKAILDDLNELLKMIPDAKAGGHNVHEIQSAMDDYFSTKECDSSLSKYDIKKTRGILTENNWETYYNNIQEYSTEKGFLNEEDPFLSMLSEREYKELSESINEEFSRKTSVKNKLDISFLAIAIALEVAKGLLYPVVAEQAGYGQSFDPAQRLDHNDKTIEETHRQANDAFRDKYAEKHGKGAWIEFLYRTVPYDTTVGTGLMDDVNLHGGAHRLYTLGHDPILGWIFGTANILTDVITISSGAVVGNVSESKISEFAKLASIRSYRVERMPKLKITSERVSMPAMFKESYEVARQDPMNLPAAIFTVGQHLKSDVNTKMGLPVPILETFAPNYASKLYTEHYDALCFARDVKIVGKSATISILIDTIIGLVHGLYYNPQKDGSRDLFEVRTRKILLVANTIGTGSNLIFSCFTGNAKTVDIGGLLVTLTHVFSDTKFLLNVKKEFIEKKLYKKIEDELKELDHIEQELLNYGESHRGLYKI
ncbi:MAG: hypothetical protein LUI14_07425 [Lachnospiraceae bacterium]|nr:hypothetical protein [Lachnospiraceae bacterium]